MDLKLSLGIIFLSCLQVFSSHGLLSEDLGPSRIMMLPMPGENHTQESSISHLAEELVGLGHEVFLLIPHDYHEIDQLKKHGIKPLIYGSGSSRPHREYGRKYHGIEDSGEHMDLPYDEFVRNQVPFYKSHCTAALGDPDLLQRLRRMNFDLAIIDAHPLSRCLYVIPYRLGVSYVSIAKQLEPPLQGLPFAPSVTPFVFGSDFTEQMTFWQRLKNLWSFFSWTYEPNISILQKEFLGRYIPEKEIVDADDLAKDSLLWLIESDPLLDYPSPRMPNMINVGGLTTRRPKQIPNDLGRFIDEAKDGVILVDLGEHSENMPYDMTEKITSALKQTRYNVVWNLPGERPTRHSSRIKFVDEFPRNDLMGHVNTRLYISDGDQNGQFESIYHGIPSIIFPFHGLDSYTANRAAYRGYGIRIDMNNFTPNQLIEAIEEITRNHSYTENVQRASRIFKSRKGSPQERAAEGIEEILMFGGDYMKTFGTKLSLWSFYLVDMFFYGFVGAVVCSSLMYWMMRWVVRRLCCGRPKHGRYDDDDDDDEDGFYNSEGKASSVDYSSQDYQKTHRGYRGPYKAKRY